MANNAVWLNGRIVRGSRARVPVSDRGLLYGDGLFETLRVYGGKPYLLTAHLARLRRSARALGIPLPGDTRYWSRALSELLAVHRLSEAAVRITVTRGTDAGLAPSPRPQPTVLVQLRRLAPGLAAAQRDGLSACLLPFDRGGGFLVPHKTLAYLPAVLGRRIAQRRGAEEGLYVTAAGLVTEATTANLFVWHRNRLWTPAAGVLPGITRALVIDLARRSGYRVAERDLSRAMLRSVSEAFLTSSVAEITPLVRVDGRTVGGGRPGPVTRTLQQAYRARVARVVGRKV
jgi:branched-subunit amino acid aminotransferase/4-amino-4-deoxychorismate lyase